MLRAIWRRGQGAEGREREAQQGYVALLQRAVAQAVLKGSGFEPEGAFALAKENPSLSESATHPPCINPIVTIAMLPRPLTLADPFANPDRK